MSPRTSIQSDQRPTSNEMKESEDSDVEKEQPIAGTAEDGTIEEDKWISGAKLWIVMTGMTLVLFVLLLDISILSTATPKITSTFNSIKDIGWYGASYQLASATLQPLTGKIYSNFNTKWSYFGFFMVFELGSLLCAVSTSSNMLIVARAVAGMGASGLQNGGLTIISSCRPMRDRPALFGIFIGVGQLGLICGPLIGGLFTQFVSWRWCFYINLPLGGIVAVLLVFIRIPDQIAKPEAREVLREIHKKLDLFGFALFAPAAIMLLLAVQYGGNQYAWDSSIVIGLFCGFGVMFLLWLAWDYHKEEAAMIPLGLLRKLHVWTSCMAAAFLGAGMFLTSYYLPMYFQTVRGKSPAISGVFLLPGILSQLVGAVVSGKAVGIFGYYLPWMFASAMLTSVCYGLFSTLSPTSSTGEWIGYQIIGGTGRGIGLQMPFIAIQNTLSPAEIPTAMSLVVFIYSLGGALFLSFADTIFTNRLRSLLEQDAPGVDAQAVFNAGAYGIRDLLGGPDLRGVLDAYSGSIDSVFYLAAALAAATFVLAFGMGWVDIRKDSSSSAKPPSAEKEDAVSS